MLIVAGRPYEPAGIDVGERDDLPRHHIGAGQRQVAVLRHRRDLDRQQKIGRIVPQVGEAEISCTKRDGLVFNDRDGVVMALRRIVDLDNGDSGSQTYRDQRTAAASGTVVVRTDQETVGTVEINIGEIGQAVERRVDCRLRSGNDQGLRAVARHDDARGGNDHGSNRQRAVLDGERGGDRRRASIGIADRDGIAVRGRKYVHCIFGR